jgi:outer membrane protein OmpA-like peptidoglycan-associated protein
MPEPAADQTGKSVNGATPDNGATPGNGSDASEYAQLRDLLVGPERDQIAEIQERLDNPEKRAADLAEALPVAVRKARSKPLRDALEPIFEKAFEISVRKHPRDLADAIYPVIGPAIRNSIAASIREFAENLNQIVEKSASFRAMRWRMEARMTGKRFSEILLTRSLLYRVEQVFLIHRKSGLLLLHVAAKASVLKDADMISGMLTAIQDFVSDSFAEGGQDLENLNVGRFKLWIQYGPKAMVVGAVSGTAPSELTSVFRTAVEKVHENFYAELDNFKQDDLSVFEPARPLLEACLLGQSAPDKRRQPFIVWAFAGLIVLLIGGFIWYRIHEQSKWDRYFAALKSAPGIIVTGIERQPPGYVVTGMKDPKANERPDVLRAEGLDANAVRYEWQPFLSLNTPFAREREVEERKRRIERQLIRFEVNSSKLQLAEADKIADIVEAMRASPGMRVTLTGRADETGSPATNGRLSEERAQHVIDALTAEGISGDRLEPVALGNLKPLRSGGTEWALADNRSVALKVK